MSLLNSTHELLPLEKDKKVVISKTAGLLRYIKGAQQRLTPEEFTKLLDTVGRVLDELDEHLEQIDTEVNRG